MAIVSWNLLCVHAEPELSLWRTSMKPAIFFEEEARRCTSPKREDDERDDILQGWRASDSLVLTARHERIAVDIEHD